MACGILPFVQNLSASANCTDASTECFETDVNIPTETKSCLIPKPLKYIYDVFPATSSMNVLSEACLVKVGSENSSVINNLRMRSGDYQMMVFKDSESQKLTGPFFKSNSKMKMNNSKIASQISLGGFCRLSHSVDLNLGVNFKLDNNETDFFK